MNLFDVIPGVILGIMIGLVVASQGIVRICAHYPKVRLPRNFPLVFGVVLLLLGVQNGHIWTIQYTLSWLGFSPPVPLSLGRVFLHMDGAVFMGILLHFALRYPTQRDYRFILAGILSIEGHQITLGRAEAQSLLAPLTGHHTVDNRLLESECSRFAIPSEVVKRHLIRMWLPYSAE